MSCIGCPFSLLFRSFYDKTLSEEYVAFGHGIGFIPLFVLSILVGLIYAVYSMIFLNSFAPEMITKKVTNLPEIQIQNGQIVQPENFFQRYQIGNGLHLTIDTTADKQIVTDPTPNEIYISKNGIQFVKGHKVELLPLSKVFGTENMTITQDSIVDFVTKTATEMTFMLPMFVFLIAIPVLFLKYVVLVYLLALFSYLATFFPKLEIPFEARMRLAAVSTLPIFVFNMIFGAWFGLFYLGAIVGTIVSLIYLFFYLSSLPKIEKA